MNVILLTVFVGIGLVGFFIFLFVHQNATHRSNDARDALLPLEEEKPTPARPRKP